jgi:hypothetical protein
MIDPKAKLLAALEHAEEFRGLAFRANDRGERELYERMVELCMWRSQSGLRRGSMGRRSCPARPAANGLSIRTPRRPSAKPKLPQKPVLLKPKLGNGTPR